MSNNPACAALPAGIEKCANLRVCFFQDTSITSLPDGMADLTAFERVIAPKAMDAGDAEAKIAGTAEAKNGFFKKL